MTAVDDDDQSSYDNSIPIPLKLLEKTPLNVLNLTDDSFGTPPNIFSLTSNSTANSVYRYEMTKNASSGINFLVLHINIQGLCSSLYNLKSLIANSSPQIIGLCETFLHKDNDVILDIFGYDLEFVNRLERKRGGLEFHIADYLDYTLRSHMCRHLDGNFESVFIEILIDNKKTIIGEIYRPPIGSMPSLLGIFNKDMSEI